MNIVDGFEANVAAHPDLPAILFEGERISYAELGRRARALAGALLELERLEPGERVALCMGNTPDFITAYLALQKLGAVVVSVAPMLKTPEVEHVLRDSGARLLLTTVERAVSWREAESSVACRIVDSGQLVLRASEDINGSSRETASANLETGAPAAILYTSGTTGKQKGAVLTHGNLISNAATTAACVGARLGSRHLLFVPLFHCFGQNFIMNMALRSGGTLALLRRFDPSTLLDQLASWEVTHFYGVPSVFMQLLEQPDLQRRLRSVAYFFSAAATLPTEVAARFLERLGKPIYEGYGLTETSPLASYNHVTQYRLGSVGTPIVDVEMKVVDESGGECPAGAWGEICIKGPNVMAGYFEQPEATAAAIVDDWFHSGDIGYRDADGYYYLVDRLKDMINRSGFKIWPREVEEALYEHPAVAECAVVGVPDPMHGELVRAYVRLRPEHAVSADELLAHCRARLANYKLPSDFVLGANIPRSPAGKVLKRVLRSQVSE